MNDKSLRQLLRRVQRGEWGVSKALEELRHLPYEDLGYVRLDHHRALRKGFPEVVFCETKPVEQAVEIVARLAARHRPVLATRVDRATSAAIQSRMPEAVYHEAARVIVVGPVPKTRRSAPLVLVLTAGTSDISVGEEAAITAEAMGSRVERLFDVGVAGIHRLLDHRKRLGQARVIIAVAGMEGALPSVVAGLVAAPVIAVPTSVGYGTGAGGYAALLSMLNSCAPGVVCVNIDNGFGAGFCAHLISSSIS